jgi:hypothetical protein
MQRKMKMGTIAVLVVVALLVSPYVYSLLTAQKSFSNTMSIKGVGVDVLAWIDDTTPPTTSVTGHDWGVIAGGDVVYYQVCVRNTGTQNLTLSFSSTLNASVGTVAWQIQWADQGGMYWDATTWKDWATGIATNGLVGSNTNPFAPNTTLGMAPTLPQPVPVTGHIRIAVTILSNAPFGAVQPFTITITGTEKV